MKSELEVTLLHHAPISLVIRAARMCTDSLDKMTSEGDNLTEPDKKVLVNKIFGDTSDPMNPSHESVIEHATYTFDINGVSRALLQELMRHRIASPSVQSTRYALTRMFNKATAGKSLPDALNQLLILTGDSEVDNISRINLANIIGLNRKRVAKGDKKVKNDILKFPLPESFRLRLQYTINARSLRNLLVLRTSKRAMWEIRRLAHAMYTEIPEHHKFMFADRVHPAQEV